MLKNDAFDDENLYNLATFIISLVQKFQPPVMDTDVETWKIGMLNELGSENFNYTDFLVVFFKSIFNMIETIVKYHNKYVLEQTDQVEI